MMEDGRGWHICWGVAFKSEKQIWEAMRIGDVGWEAIAVMSDKYMK